MSMKISFLFDELITGGAVLSAFELCEALRELDQECYIVSPYRNEELEDYFNIKPIIEPKGTTITFTPKRIGDYAYIRTKDGRWFNHKEPKIAVSKFIADWIGTKTIIGNGTRECFKDLHKKRDIDVLIEGNYEPNKNIKETVKEAQRRFPNARILWFGRRCIEIPGVETIENPSIESIPSIYNKAKTFLKMSKCEGWGRPVAEAQACGCKVINLSGGNKNIKIVKWQEIAKQLINYLDGISKSEQKSE